jgi:hypothetical protein
LQISASQLTGFAVGSGTAHVVVGVGVDVGVGDGADDQVLVPEQPAPLRPTPRSASFRALSARFSFLLEAAPRLARPRRQGRALRRSIFGYR